MLVYALIEQLCAKVASIYHLLNSCSMFDVLKLIKSSVLALKFSLKLNYHE